MAPLSRAKPVFDPAILLAALPDPVIALDRDGAVRFVNPAAEQFLGIGAPALHGARLADFIVPQSPLFNLVEAIWRDGGSIAEYDVLLEGPQGAVALAEYAAARAPYLLRTAEGPRLVHDPWGGAAAAA